MLYQSIGEKSKPYIKKIVFILLLSRNIDERVYKIAFFVVIFRCIPYIQLGYIINLNVQLTRVFFKHALNICFLKIYQTILEGFVLTRKKLYITHYKFIDFLYMSF